MFEEGKTYENRYSSKTKFKCVLANENYAVLECRLVASAGLDFCTYTREHFKNFKEVRTPRTVYVGTDRSCIDTEYFFFTKEGVENWVAAFPELNRTYKEFVEVLEDG